MKIVISLNVGERCGYPIPLGAIGPQGPKQEKSGAANRFSGLVANKRNYDRERISTANKNRMQNDSQISKGHNAAAIGLPPIGAAGNTGRKVYRNQKPQIWEQGQNGPKAKADGAYGNHCHKCIKPCALGVEWASSRHRYHPEA